MTFQVEQDWITQAGLRAVVIYIEGRHRCGYVAVTKDSPLYGKDYSEQLDIITEKHVDNLQCGDRSPLLLFTATVGSDGEDKIRRSLDILIDVHGGLTFSGGAGKYPVEAPDLWWFGFDCAHYNDDSSIGGRTLDFCISECESMAKQLQQLVS